MQKHGITMGLNSFGDIVFLEMKIFGKLTHNDYKTITPMLDSMINAIEDSRINVLIDARNFEGWELQAAWDDFQLGIKNIFKFSKIAVVGNKEWEKYLVKIANWFIPIGEIKYFESINDGYAWITTNKHNLTPTQKDIYDRIDEIEEDFTNLLNEHIKITSLNVPEADEQEAKKLILEIFKNKLKGM